MPILEGLGYGVITAFLIGHVFFTLLRAAMDYGFWGGASVALGIITSDVLVALICMTGAIALFEGNVNEGWLALAAGIILAVLGAWYTFNSNANKDQEVRLGSKNALGLYTAGFLVNFINPFVFVVWTGYSLRASAGYAADHNEWLFIISILVGIFLTDIVKSALAPKLRKILAPHLLKKVYRGIGIVLLLFSIRVFIHAYTHWS
ncbi:MAG: LysE family transporter [Flavobacteriales bacterium]|nr:LysE family transporter [Flavobacteriales bacterium]